MSKIRFHAYTDMPSTPLEEDSVIITRDGNYIKIFVTSQDGTPYEHRTIYTGEPNQIKIDDLHVSLDNHIIDEINSKIDEAFADSKYALRTRTITAGDGLEGGGNLTANRTISLSSDAKSDIQKGVEAHDYTLDDVAKNGNTTSVKLVGDEEFSNTEAEDYAQMADLWKAGYSIQYLNNEYKLVLRRKDDFIISEVDLSSLVTGNLSVHIDDTDPADPELVFSQDGVEVGRIPASALLTGVVDTGELVAKQLHFKDRTGTVVINIDLSPVLDVKAEKTTTINAGTGLSGGGTLASNRTINFDTTWGDNRYQRLLAAGDNVSISGNEISATDTKYTAGNGLTLSGTAFSLPVTTTGSGTFVKGVSQGTNGINIELGTPPNTTYSNMSLAELNTGTVTTARSISAKTLNDWGNLHNILGNGNTSQNRGIILQSGGGTSASYINEYKVSAGSGGYSRGGFIYRFKEDGEDDLDLIIGVSHIAGSPRRFGKFTIGTAAYNSTNNFWFEENGRPTIGGTNFVTKVNGLLANNNGEINIDLSGYQKTLTASNGITISSENVITPTYGTTANTIAQGNDSRINNGQTAYQYVNPNTLSWATTNATDSTGHTHELSIDVFARIVSDLNQTYDLNDIGDNYRSGFASVWTHANAQIALNYPWEGGGGNLLNFNNGLRYRTQIFHNRAGTRIAYRAKINDSTYRSWVEFITDLNLNSQATALGFIKSSALSGYVPTSRTLTAGNGLSGGGTLAANRTITLGTPSAIGLGTTNSVTSTSHTHALDSATTTAINQGVTAHGWGNHSGLYVSTSGESTISSGGRLSIYNNDHSGWFNNIVGDPENYYTRRNFSIESSNNQMSFFINGGFNSRRAGIQVGHSGSFANTGILELNPFGGDVRINGDTATHIGNLDSQATSLGFIKSADLTGYVPTGRTITAGNGLTGGGSLAANRTITLGTPSEITLSSTNSVTTNSHTHAFTPGGTTAQYIRGNGTLATFPSIPTVNNGQLTLSTGAGLTGSGTFTANQSGNSSFSVGIASTHKLPTVSEWNSLPTTNTTYTGSNGIDLVGTDFRLSAGTLSNIQLGVTANSWGDHSGLYLEKATLNLSPATSWDTLTENRIVFSSSNANSPYSAYGIGFNFYHTDNQRAQLFFSTGHSNQNDQKIQYRLGNSNTGFSAVRTIWDDNNFNPAQYVLQSALNTQLANYVPTSRTITINGTTFDLSANRAWTIPDNDTITRLRGTTSGTYTSGDLTLVAGANTTITQSGATITIASTNTNTTYSGSTSITLSGTSFRRAALTGDVTAAANSNATTIANNAVTTAKIANSAVTHAKYQNIATQRILGRGAAGTGNVQELTLGANLSLSTAGVLSATNTNTTYSAGTLALLNAGTNTTNRVWGAKTIADYVKQYTGENLGLQGVTNIGNWTDKDIILGSSESNPSVTFTKGLPQTDNRVGLYSETDKLVLATGINPYSPNSSYATQFGGTVGLVDNIGVWANSFSLGSDFGFNFGYTASSTTETSNSNPFVTINLDTQTHHTERMTLNTPSGSKVRQKLSFPPEEGTLATREWLDNEGYKKGRYMGVGSGQDTIGGNTTTSDAIESLNISTWHSGPGRATSNNSALVSFRPYSNGAYGGQFDLYRTGDLYYRGINSGNPTSWYRIWTSKDLRSNSENDSRYARTLTNSTTNTISGTQIRRAALTGDVTAAANSNATTIANNAVTTAKIANGAVTLPKIQNISTQRILGRAASGSGVIQELTLGSNLSLTTSGVLSAANTDTTYSQATYAQIVAGVNLPNRLINPRDLKNAIDNATGPKQVIITASTELSDYVGYTIVFNGTNASIGPGSASIERGAEWYLLNNTSSNRPIYAGSSTYRLSDGTTFTDTLYLKPWGVATIVRIGTTSTFAIYGDIIK